MTGIEIGIGWIIASIATAAIGTAVSVVGAVQAAAARSNAARFQAQVAANNIILSQRAAEDARKRGDVEANLRRTRSRLEQGKIRASLAGAGVQVDTGSALQTVEDAAAFGELDALTIRSNAEREALGFEAEGASFSAQAAASLAAARQARIGGAFTAAGTLASGVSNVADKWIGFKVHGAVK